MQHTSVHTETYRHSNRHTLTGTMTGEGISTISRDESSSISSCEGPASPGPALAALPAFPDLPGPGKATAMHTYSTHRHRLGLPTESCKCGDSNTDVDRKPSGPAPRAPHPSDPSDSREKTSESIACNSSSRDDSARLETDHEEPANRDDDVCKCIRISKQTTQTNTFSVPPLHAPVSSPVAASTSTMSSSPTLRHSATSPTQPSSTVLRGLRIHIRLAEGQSNSTVTTPICNSENPEFLCLVLPSIRLAPSADNPTLASLRAALLASPQVGARTSLDIFFPSWTHSIFVTRADESDAVVHSIETDAALQDVLAEEVAKPGTFAIRLEQCKNDKYSRFRRDDTHDPGAAQPQGKSMRGRPNKTGHAVQPVAAGNAPDTCEISRARGRSTRGSIRGIPVTGPACGYVSGGSPHASSTGPVGLPPGNGYFVAQSARSAGNPVQAGPVHMLPASMPYLPGGFQAGRGAGNEVFGYAVEEGAWWGGGKRFPNVANGVAAEIVNAVPPHGMQPSPFFLQNHQQQQYPFIPISGLAGTNAGNGGHGSGAVAYSQDGFGCDAGSYPGVPLVTQSTFGWPACGNGSEFGYGGGHGYYIDGMEYDNGHEYGNGNGFWSGNGYWNGSGYWTGLGYEMGSAN